MIDRLRRFAPKSLIGQIALVMAGALLVAQAINFTLIFTERQRLTRTQLEGPPVARFVTIAQRVAEAAPAERPNVLPRRGRRGRFSIDAASPIPPGGDEALLDRLRDTAAANGLTLRDARAAIIDDVPPPPPDVRENLPPEEIERMDDRRQWMHMLVLSVQLSDGTWLTGRMIAPRPNLWVIVRPLVATLLTYLIILAAMIWIARRLARPLRELASAAERFQGRGEAPRVEPGGPEDVNRAILAFNAMSARVGAMLDEKDRMLGAIGHDLRTPLASLRIRAETIEPAEDRNAMIATIEEMAAMLDDTLALARSGRAVEEVRAIDLAALADTVVEEYRALGKDVALMDGARGSARVQPRLLRRAVRNLVANAVTYAGATQVAVRADGEDVLIEVIDTGPGIDAAELGKVLEPFYRVEPSRSRETGGSGLGLTLARAAAQAHGGELELENRPEGGLIARLRIPAQAEAANI